MSAHVDISFGFEVCLPISPKCLKEVIMNSSIIMFFMVCGWQEVVAFLGCLVTNFDPSENIASAQTFTVAW